MTLSRPPLHRLLPLFACAAGLLAGEAAVVPQCTVATPATQELRGFGRVATTTVIYRVAGGGTVNELTFNCAAPDKAATVAGKFLGDLGLSPGVVAAELAVGGERLPISVTADGAMWCAAVQGSVARIVGAARREDLAAFAAEQPGRLRGAVAKADYPAFLDRFDRYGWGLYGMDGHKGGQWQEYIKQPVDDDGPKTPTQDIDWLAKHGFRFEPWLDPAMGHVNSDGIVRNTEAEWQVKYATSKGLPVSFRLYGSQLATENDWTNRRFGAYLQQPAGFLQRYINSYSPWCEVSWFSSDIHKYQAVKARDQVARFAGNPLALGWMHPYGEFSAGDWHHEHADFSHFAQDSWRAFLRQRGHDLAAVSRLYGHATRPFGDWSQVQVPEFATFAGLEQQVVDLAGQWWYRRDSDKDFRPDDAWWAKPYDQRYPGTVGKWWEGPIDAAWAPLSMPGGDSMDRLFGWRVENPATTTWFRRGFTLTREQLGDGPLYLYWFPISFEGIHSGEKKRYHQVYINGAKAGEIGSWGALEVGKLLRTGDNAIALQLHGTHWEGRVFLSREAPRIYPYLGDDRNQLWLAWRTWMSSARIQSIATVLDGMRQADPDRPIKYMAPIPLGSDHWLKLATDWGGFAHFTGEGMWFFPWYKRYGWLYGLPGSSETAGPPNPTPSPIPDQFDSFRRVFMAGLNAHDPVFVAEWYTRHPELRRWWESHNPVLKQLGRFDLAGDQVLLYRATLMDTKITPRQPYPRLGESTRPIQTPWDWDLGRGTLQSLGQSYVYLDDTGLADGKMNGFKVMIDSGNELMPAASVRSIEAWVRNGGTFVALPFTGRNSLTAPDAWQMRELTGCAIAAQRVPGKGTVTIGKDQRVLAASAGRTFPDQGRSMDWVGNNHDLSALELKPGPDCEVLATYENGAAAVVRRKLGSGAVIWFGSAFWRDCQDRSGIWWPEPRESAFVADLLAGTGYPAAPCVCDDPLVWPQPYRSNNGQDLVSVLVSWNNDKAVTTTLRLRVPRKPLKLVSFGVDGEVELPFDWKDGEAVTRIAMPAKEVKVVRALGCTEPFDALSHWWGYQQRLWHEIKKPAIDLEPYTRGEWADPTLDLRPDARLTTTAPVGDAWMKPGFDAAAWKPCPMTVLDIYGAEAGKPLWLRKTFTVPAAWTGRGGAVRLVSGSSWGPRYAGSARLFLNGTMLHDWSNPKDWSIEHTDADITRLVVPGDNVVALEFKGDKPSQGVLGQVYLYHRPAPALSIPLAGAWTARDADGKAIDVVLPGKSDLIRPERSVFIPKEWEGRYRVRIYLEGHRYQTKAVEINGSKLVRGVPWPSPNDFDITDYLRFGEDNAIVLPTIGRREGWHVDVVRLDLYPEP
ncbi:MAG: hypothetical protein HY859_02475 [Caulobacterales bacterium]|nr:hypothetical protein [Caulobacterales bacterium]